MAVGRAFLGCLSAYPQTKTGVPGEFPGDTDLGNAHGAEEARGADSCCGSGCTGLHGDYGRAVPWLAHHISRRIHTVISPAMDRGIQAARSLPARPCESRNTIFA